MFGPVQAFLAVAVMSIAMVVQAWVQPYENNVINVLDLLSMAAVFLTRLGALLHSHFDPSDPTLPECNAKSDNHLLNNHLLEDLAACREGRKELARWNGFSLLFLQIALVGAFVAALLQEYLKNHAMARTCRRVATREVRTRFAAWQGKRAQRKARRAEAKELNRVAAASRTSLELLTLSGGISGDSSVFERPNPLTPGARGSTVVGFSLTPTGTAVGLTQPGVEALPPGWTATEHHSGGVFYSNNTTGECVWERPRAEKAIPARVVKWTGGESSSSVEPSSGKSSSSASSDASSDSSSDSSSDLSSAPDDGASGARRGGSTSVVAARLVSAKTSRVRVKARLLS